MDLFEAAYRVAHDYRDGEQQGAVALARKMGKHPGTFLNEVNPAQDSHKLGLGDAQVMQLIANDHRIAQAMATNLGGAYFRLPDLSDLSDVALLEVLGRCGAELGDLFRSVNASLADNRISRADFARIEGEGMEAIAAVAEALARMRGMIDG